jgi:hypothetical protein
MAYDPKLPDPAAIDIDPHLAGKPARWTCRHCGFTETGLLTTDAVTRRRAAHECRCPERPTCDVPTDTERDAYQSVHAAGLRRDLLNLFLRISDRERLLRRTWIFEIRARRSLRREIEATWCEVAGVHAHAISLGLDDSWHESYLPPVPR